MSNSLLAPDELSASLEELSGWNVVGKTITKTFEFPSFGQAMQFVNQVTRLAESQDHHPDIDIRYDKVILTLSTHSAGGITDKDIEFAERIEKL